MALPTADPGITQARLHLQRGTVARLLEWQSRAVASGLPKPTYSELVDAVVAAPALDPDGVVRLLRERG